MAGYFQKRKCVKHGKEWVRHAELCRHLRADLVPPQALESLNNAEAELKDAIAQKDIAKIESGCGAVQKAVSVLMPPKSFSGFRENLEVFVVAIAVAMAFRTYCLQPFKIPTGSMQPTLYGIHYEPADGKSLFDNVPLKYAQWLLFGKTYTECTAQTAGTIRGPYSMRRTGDGVGEAAYEIGGLAHAIPWGLPLTVKNGDEVVTGQVIARGYRITGDHLFVNRIKWNFMKPSRGEVMVFRTDGIPIRGLTEQTHYIKRMCGLPNESISIHEPYLYVNGAPVMEPAAIRRIAEKAPGYAGYCLGEISQGAEFIRSTNDVRTLGPDQYLALGDNTHNSLDGRYWGTVPAENLVGPAMVVYWPFSRRWGWIQ
jgi:signal peptidase I